MYSDYELNIVPLSLKSAKNRVEAFLHSCGLRLDPVDHYAVVNRVGEDQILAGGGLQGDVIKCVAVTDELRGTGMMQRLISHLIATAGEHGFHTVKVFTKPENQPLFESLGFKLLATAPKAIFMENGQQGIGSYVTYLQGLYKSGKNGAIVMNANPFTLGHQALVEHATSRVDHLYVIVVKEDLSLFSYAERKAMVEAGCAHLSNVTVCDGSQYAISAATFPTYFLKQLDDATDTQITLDLSLYAQHIAPALGATIRFVGSEPNDAVTARYVELMQQQLPAQGIEVEVLPRVSQGSHPISASNVRQQLAAGSLSQVAQIVPASSLPYILGMAVRHALLAELETTPKPGLVDRHDSGAHSDMDFATMMASIDALRPHFLHMAQIGFSESLPSVEVIKQAGLAAETDMLAATGGVNTHRGALFAMGLMVMASAHLVFVGQEITPTELSNTIRLLASGFPSPTGTHGSQATEKFQVKGALDLAREGYKELMTDWLPYYQKVCKQEHANLKTLLYIMTQLDDTNVLHRCGTEVAAQVKQEANQTLQTFSVEQMEALNTSFIARNISPGGVADMLALTILAHFLTN